MLLLGSTILQDYYCRPLYDDFLMKSSAVFLRASFLKRHRKASDPASQLKIEAEMASRVAARAKEIVAERIQSEEVQKIVEQRLREERLRLEQKVSWRHSNDLLCNTCRIRLGEFFERQKRGSHMSILCFKDYTGF